MITDFTGLNFLRRNILPASTAGAVLVQFIISSLAVWRVSSLLVNEPGPWYVFKRLREQQGFQYYPDGDTLHEPDNHVLGCVWCTSIWVALLLLVVPFPIKNALALSAVACILEGKVGYGHS